MKSSPINLILILNWFQILIAGKIKKVPEQIIRWNFHELNFPVK